MSMRGPGGEQNSTGEPSKVELSVGQEVVCSTGHCTSPTTAAGPIPLFSKCRVSPLLNIFRSKEIVPRILDYEKAILVIKEHDYAKKPERAEVLQLSSVIEAFPFASESQSEATNIADPVSVLLNASRDIQDLRESLCRREDTLISSQLRELVSIHIELIRDQQEQLHDKDKELSTVRKDKEQLEARLERMERRLAISQKRSHSKYDNFDTEASAQQEEEQQLEQQQQFNTYTCTTGQPLMPKLRTHLDIINSDRQPRSRSSSNDRGTRTSRRVHSQSETLVSQEVLSLPELQQTGNMAISSSAKRSSKRKTQNEVPSENIPKRRKTKQGEIRTRVEYVGLDLTVCQPKKLNLSQQRLPPNSDTNSTYMPNHFDEVGNNAGLANCSSLSSSSCNMSVHGSEGGRSMMNGNDETIVVPSWRTSVVKPSEHFDSDEIEDISGDAYAKRHRKPEEDEKRRKRWDLQRARNLHYHGELLRKYNQKGGGGGAGGEKPEKKKDRLVTFIPTCAEVEAIEIKDTIAVTAFGMPLPFVKSQEFELVWFDLDMREAKESLRTTRSKAKEVANIRSSVSSSAEEDCK